MLPTAWSAKNVMSKVDALWVLTPHPVTLQAQILSVMHMASWLRLQAGDPAGAFMNMQPPDALTVEPFPGLHVQTSDDP